MNLLMKSDMIAEIFPPKPEDCDLSDRAYETYCIQVWCLNSMNAVSGMVSHHKDRVNLAIYRELNKAAQVINFLLEETGRDKE